MTTINLYANSLRHLRPIQISSRIRLLARRKLRYRGDMTRSDRYASPEAPAFHRLNVSAPQNEGLHEHDFARNEFIFLNHRQALGAPIDWFPASATQLWKYNLHYFDYTEMLAVRYRESRDVQAFQAFRRLAKSWMDACPVATPLAWDPYPISLRITNWIKAYAWFAPALAEEEPFAVRLRQSIWSQARFLEDNLEYHLLGNHLIENGRALLFAGLFFQGETARRWRDRGIQILDAELAEQFLADGGHYERSPMYHQIMLHLYDDVIDVLARQGETPPAMWRSSVERMRRWLQAMVHPDGEIALFNDAAFKIAGSPLKQIGDAPLQDGFQALLESGYFIFRDKQAGNYLALDCGPLGPDYQPGHGPSDTLSYELSLGGRRFIVDAGVSNYYGDQARRHYDRSTMAHNTVMIDGQEQSEVWGRFRVARRAYPLDVRHHVDDGLTYVIGSHTGYRRLPGKPTHRRWVGWIDRRFWVIVDRIDGDGEHRLENFLHFHPQANARQLSVTTASRDWPLVGGRIEGGDQTLHIAAWGVDTIETIRGELDPIQGWYAPEFGMNQSNEVWSLQHQGPSPHWMGYVLWPGSQPPNSIEFNVSPDGQSQLTLTTADETYTVTCAYDEMRMEKEV